MTEVGIFAENINEASRYVLFKPCRSIYVTVPNKHTHSGQWFEMYKNNGTLMGYADAYCSGARLDDVLATRMPAPSRRKRCFQIRVPIIFAPDFSHNLQLFPKEDTTSIFYSPIIGCGRKTFETSVNSARRIKPNLVYDAFVSLNAYNPHQRGDLEWSLDRIQDIVGEFDFEPSQLETLKRLAGWDKERGVVIRVKGSSMVILSSTGTQVLAKCDTAFWLGCEVSFRSIKIDYHTMKNVAVNCFPLSRDPILKPLEDNQFDANFILTDEMLSRGVYDLPYIGAICDTKSKLQTEFLKEFVGSKITVRLRCDTIQYYTGFVRWSVVELVLPMLYEGVEEACESLDLSSTFEPRLTSSYIAIANSTTLLEDEESSSLSQTPLTELDGIKFDIDLNYSNATTALVNNSLGEDDNKENFTVGRNLVSNFASKKTEPSKTIMSIIDETIETMSDLSIAGNSRERNYQHSSSDVPLSSDATSNRTNSTSTSGRFSDGPSTIGIIIEKESGRVKLYMNDYEYRFVVLDEPTLQHWNLGDWFRLYYIEETRQITAAELVCDSPLFAVPFLDRVLVQCELDVPPQYSTDIKQRIRVKRKASLMEFKSFQPRIIDPYGMVMKKHDGTTILANLEFVPPKGREVVWRINYVYPSDYGHFLQKPLDERQWAKKKKKLRSEVSSVTVTTSAS